ncbi:pyridine nucleotide-disulfide oxidoreductase [uncultured Actinomyces sp.]|uniref:pyridine nucleotide-disulfide oxidoreductase n=1 Tax=uncultured Actinomyces sp. TaxID=249061 RepID=UPI0028E209BB|nr:pyridine nucleotide-disulfide oxidoreductase [uncultured Actinomyces sp.]
MNDPHAPLREVRRWMRVSTPVNKAASSGLRGRLPQIAGPLMIGALGVGALGAGIAWRALSSTRGTGRTQRFVDLATAALDARFPERATDEACVNDASSGEHRVVNVEVGEGFGRPSLVSIDVVLPAQDALTDPVAATSALDEVTRATWNNDEMAPVSVRARILVARTDDGDADSLAAPGAQTDTVVDMTALGFADEIARPDELYDRYGAPECDPAWRP